MSKTGSGTPWLLGVIVLLLCLNATYSVVEIVVNGPQADINILSLAGGTFYVPVSFYFLASMLAATVCFGYFCSVIIRKLTIESAATAMFDLLDKKSQHNRELLEKSFTEKFAKLSMDEFEVTEDLKNIKMQLTENQKSIQEIGKMRGKYEAPLKKQISALKEIKKKTGEIESILAPKPQLTSCSNIQKIGSLDQETAEKLKSAGITRVEDLITEYPKNIALKTKIPKTKIEKIQATAQFLMIPGIDKKKAKLLQKAGITSTKNLADQDPINLFKKLSNATENINDKPTLEEIASYIRFAKSSFSVFY